MLARRIVRFQSVKSATAAAESKNENISKFSHEQTGQFHLTRYFFIFVGK